MTRGNLSDVDLMRNAAMDVDRFVAVGAVLVGDGDDARIVSLSLADAQGNVLFDQLVRPEDADRWPGAKIVRGVHMDAVKQARSLRDLEGELRDALRGATVLVGYDLDRVLQAAEAAGVVLPAAETFDLKAEWAKAHGRWSERSKDYTFATLGELAARYGHAPQDNPALAAAADAQAAAAAYRGFVGECRDDMREAGLDPNAARAVEGGKRRVSHRAWTVVAIVLAIIAAVLLAIAFAR